MTPSRPNCHNAGMIEVDGCPCCFHHASVRILYKETFDGVDAETLFLRDRAKAVHGEIRKCDNCGFVFTGWQFTHETYAAIYESRPPIRFGRADSVRQRRLISIVRQKASGHRFVEIGGGGGAFTERLLEHGYLGRNFEVGDDFQRWAWDHVESVDFIVAWDVLEHLPDLRRYLHAAQICLRRNGALLATLPNVESWTARILGERWPMYLLEHLWYFSPSTLKRFAGQAGLKLVEATPIPFDVGLDTVAKRLRQHGIPCPDLPRWTVPLPVGNMLAVLRR